MKKSQVPSSFFSRWDSDMASLLLLVNLLQPPPSRNKGTVKISVRDAVDRSCRSLHEHSGPDQRRQPYIVAVGTTRDSIHDYYIAFDGELLPCKAKSIRYQIDNEPATTSVDVSDQQTVSALIPEQPDDSQSCNETRQHTQEMCASLIAKLQGSVVSTNQWRAVRAL
ncbi:hypothetical protein NQZ68_026379 [Dissostichus eleginoides]|nr:hypothetical protein NQZ68_026379 [Dissostichus eleginoides]